MDKIEAQRLMLVYKDDPSPENFTKLLHEVDDHLVICVKMMKAKFPILASEDLQSLYHDAISILPKIARSITVEHDASMIGTRIYFYVKEEVLRVYIKPYNRQCANLYRLRGPIITDRPVWANLLFQDFQNKILGLVHRRLLTAEDYSLLVHHWAYGFTCTRIAETVQRHPDTVRDRIRRAVKVIRENLNPDDFFYE